MPLWLSLALGITVANTFQQAIQAVLDHRAHVKALRAAVQKQNVAIERLLDQSLDQSHRHDVPGPTKGYA